MNKLLTDNVRETLQAQYPDEDLVEIDEHIYHLPHVEEAWCWLRDKVRPGWGVMEERQGLQHYVIYNPEYYKHVNPERDVRLVCINLTNDIELPINCSSCYEMFHDCIFPEGFEFPETFDTSEIVDMWGMFDCSQFEGDISLGVGFNTNKVKDFGCMFRGVEIKGILDLGPSFNLEYAEDVGGMFSGSVIGKPIKVGDKFNPKNASSVEEMFYGVKMPVGFNLGNNFQVKKGVPVGQLFNRTKFNDGFWLPSCFNVNEDNEGYQDMFRYAKLPNYIVDKGYKTTQEIIDAFKVKGSKTAMECLDSIQQGDN